MPYLKLKFTLLLLLIATISFGQFLYTGKILDVNTNQPLEGVNISVTASNRGKATNQHGVFKLKIERLPVVLIISHVGYEAKEKLIDTIIEGDEIIYLVPSTNLLNEITVSPEDQVESISNVDQYSITDFEILHKKIYRLEYHGTFKKYTLSVTNLLGEIEASIKLSHIKRIQSLYKSCNDIIYVLSTNNAYAISANTYTLETISKIPIDTFNQFLKPCKLRVGNKLYYINKQYNGLLSKVTMYNTDTEEYRTIRIISNQKQLENYKEDVGFIAKSQSIGNIRTNDIAENERIRNIQEDGDFLLTIFYKPKYPIYISTKKEKLVLLNHIEKRIEIYNKDILESEIAIDYVLAPNWLKKVKTDQITGKIYTIFDLKKGIGIKEINLENGTTKLVGTLDTAIQNYNHIEISNGHIFYLKKNSPNRSILELFKFRI